MRNPDCKNIHKGEATHFVEVWAVARGWLINISPSPICALADGTDEGTVAVFHIYPRS